MNIDKRALREVAERATQGPWEMEQENIWFTDEDGYTKHLAYVEQGDDVDDKQDHYNTAYIAAANPATMLALLDENIQLQREKDAIEAVALALRDDMRQAREQLAALTAEPVSQTYELPELIEGMEVSIDVSTCDADVGNRYFGTVTEVSELDSAKNGYILLVQDAKPNFKTAGNSPVIPDGWISCSERMPDNDESKPIAIFTGKCLGQGMFVATYDDDGFFDYWEGMEIIGVTHWMPLPEPPQK
ncbi:ead/Ea22-like family protein [Salmonella enterica]|nr:ead/Ea22-like family protein [Salmonella enterica]EKJ5692944.1 ead/Ea22-like family protein [Salmonella enterica]